MTYSYSFPTGMKVYRGVGPDGSSAVFAPNAWDSGAKIVARKPFGQVDDPAITTPAGAAPKIPKSDGAPLRSDIRRKMESQLGDLSSVKIHIGSESAKAATGFGARAFTVGKDVHFGSGEYAPGTKDGDRLLAHELTHTVQSAESGVRCKAEHSDGGQDGDPRAEVSDPNEPAEHEADAVADAVADQLHGNQEKSEDEQKGSTEAGADSNAARSGEAKHEPTAQPAAIATKLRPGAPRIFLAKNGPISNGRLEKNAGGGLKETPIGSRDGKKDTALVNVGKKSMAHNPHFEADAIAFEQKLGAKAFSHPASVGAAADMATKAKNWIKAKVGGTWDAANAQIASDLQKIGGDNPGWSGSVGKAIQDVMAVFDKGNVAERLNHVSSFFTEVMAKDLLDPKIDRVKKLATQSHMDAKAIIDRREEMLAKQAVRGGQENKWDIAPVPEKLPSGRRNPVGGQWHTRADRASAQGVAKDDEKSRSEVAKGGRKLEETGAQMSEREVALHKKDDPSWDPRKDAVKWEEGTRIWVMNERDSWVQIQRRISLPVGAGPSGSTSALMSAAKLFGTEPYGARAACIGYL